MKISDNRGWGMAGTINKHLWSDLANAPASAGIYAWYYNIEITAFDINQAIESLKSLDLKASRSEAEQVVRSLLDDRVFQLFRHDVYHARIDGALKASFSGSLEHSFVPSEGLVRRIVENPERLWVLRDVLESCAPWFASPLYIGMSENLRKRLGVHKALIERYRSRSSKDESPSGDADAGFAWHIAQRRIPPERLSVYTCAASDIDGIGLDIENVLNRLFYPLLGRN